jgi:hypothetical protein
MNKINTAISDALGVVDEIKESAENEKNTLIPRTSASDLVAIDRDGDSDSDYRYSRENFYNLIERGQDAITGILELAQESEHPRTYEVAGQLIKTVSDVTERLVDLQNKMKRLKEVPHEGPSNVTNALFVGSTKELQKLIKNGHADGS